MYGYLLVKELEEKGISIEGNTLYPLLRRLESQGLLKSEWETEETKPRKYYIITEDGKLVYKKIKEFIINNFLFLIQTKCFPLEW